MSWRRIDIALCKLQPEISFTDEEYFDCPTPKDWQCLMTCDMTDEEEWVFLDGATAGLMPLLRCDRRYIILAVPPSNYQGLKQYRMYNLKVVGGISELGRGICRAPVESAGTDDDESEREIFGLFSWSKRILYIFTLSLR